jgi:hypothetical protein
LTATPAPIAIAISGRDEETAPVQPNKETSLGYDATTFAQLDGHNLKSGRSSRSEALLSPRRKDPRTLHGDD